MSGAEELIKALEFRRGSMKERYQVVEPSFREVARWLDPARGRYLGQSENGDRQKEVAMADATPRKAMRTTRAGLMSGISNPARPWFKIKAPSMERPTYAMQVWLDEVQRILFEVLAGSNAYAALMQAYGDLSTFGCYGGLTKFSRDNIVHMQTMPVGAFLWAEDEEGRINTMHWTVKMTVRQMVEKWGLDKVSDRVKLDFENNRFHDLHEICAAIEPRLTANPNLPRYARNMPVGVYYWEKGRTDKFLEEGGMSPENPINGPRWETLTGDPWPISSPARDALPDVKRLQQRQKDRDMAVQMINRPPLVGPPEGALFSYTPGAYNTLSMASFDKGRPQPILNPNQINVQHLDMGIDMAQKGVNEAFFADLFRIASEYGVQGLKDVTAYGLSQLKEEQLMVLGPVLISIDRGLLAQLIENTFHYAQEAEIIPPAPEDMRGVALTVEFTGMLYQAMRALGIAPTERVVGFAGTLAQVVGPDVIKNLDGDRILRTFGEQVGFAAEGFRDPDLMAEERKAEAEAMQQQQMIQAAPQLAGAANLISEASERGQQGLGMAGGIM